MNLLDPADEWSNTKLLDLGAGCPEHFRRRWIEREPTGGTLPMRRGSAVHYATRAAHLRQKAAKDAAPHEDLRTVLREALPTREEMRDLAADEFQRLVDMEGVTLREEEEAEGPGRAQGRTKDAAADMAGAYVRAVAPFVDPLAVERRVVIQLPNGIKVAGTQDLVDRQVRHELGEPEPKVLRVVRDLKTREKSPPQGEARKTQQLTLYDMLHLAEHGQHADAVQLDVLVRTPVRGDVKHVALTSWRDDGDTDALLAKIETARAAVKAGVYMPNTESWRCDARYCEFFSSCRYVSDRRRS